MTSDRQVQANRNNSKKSTGPTSVEGKAVVAQNAVKHGILSEKVPVDETECSQYTAFFERLYSILNPQGDLQFLLADRVISTAWRLRRLLHVEALLLARSANSSYVGKYTDIFDGYSGEGVERLSRYERSLENSFFRALRELTQLQQDDGTAFLDIVLDS